MKKFIVTLLLVLCFTPIAQPTYAFSAEGPSKIPNQVTLNGQAIDLPLPLILEKGEILVPLKWFATQMGASSVKWDPTSKTVSVVVNDFLQMHQYLSYLNGLESYKNDLYPLPKHLQNLDLPPYPLTSKNPSMIHQSPISLDIVSHGSTMPWAVYDYIFKDNNLYVGIDWLNTLFLAQVTQTPDHLSITYPTADVLSQNIAALEKISLPTSAEDALTLWIRGQIRRSSGLQYIALSPSLKQTALASIYAGESWWVTGGSSPSFRNPKVTKLSSNDDTYTFQIDFDEIAGGEVFEHSQQIVTIKKYTIDDHTYWLVDEVTGDKDYFTILPPTKTPTP